MQEIHDQMFRLAKDFLNKAYVPYSKFKVAACILGNNKSLYAGANIENAAYPQGWCAECSALTSMVMDGCTNVQEILVITESTILASPCGGCRQKIREFADPASCKIHLASLAQNKIVKTYTLEDLLPDSFGPENLQEKV